MQRRVASLIPRAFPFSNMFSSASKNPGVRESLRELGRTLVEYLVIRSSIAATEAAAGLERAKRPLLLFAVALLLGLAGGGAGIAAMIFGLAPLVGSLPLAATIVAVTLFVIALTFGCAGARSISKEPIFKNLRAEIHEDIKCLKPNSSSTN